MKRSYLVLLLVSTSLFGYTDSDMDGVEDSYDKCPQTLFSDLVDLEGCTIQSTQKTIHYDLMIAEEYSKINYASMQYSDTWTTLFEADIYVKNWIFQGTTSYYRSNSTDTSPDGWNDTMLNIFYRITPTEKITLYPGVGVVIPTYKSGYNNEAVDYTALITMQYEIDSAKYLFGGYSYTWVNDRDVMKISYQNTQMFQVGIGYQFTPKSTFSLSYNQNDSIYHDIKTIQTVSAGYTQNISTHWSIGGDYGYGLSDSASDHTLIIGLKYHY
jgi:opacity protein-like surface antigen